MEFAYPVGNFFMRTALRAFAKWEVEGRENVPPMGPLVVVANHPSNIDPPLLSASLPRRLYYLAKSAIFSDPISRWILRSYGAFPLKRDKLDVRAMRWALDVLARDKTLVVFPEGTRSPSGMRKALPGVALIALKSQAPILPVGITGTERIGPLLRVAYPTGHIKVKIGQVFSLPSLEGRVKRAQLETLTTMIFQRVAVLLPESRRGVYGGDLQNAITPSAAATSKTMSKSIENRE